jgi:hypothetical protein
MVLSLGSVKWVQVLVMRTVVAGDSTLLRKLLVSAVSGLDAIDSQEAVTKHLILMKVWSLLQTLM